MWEARERTGSFTMFWWKIQRERDNLENRGVDEGMGYNNLDRLVERVWNGFALLRIESGGGSCKHGDELSISGSTGLVISYKPNTAF
jgi:hypothetical protein